MNNKIDYIELNGNLIKIRFKPDFRTIYLEQDEAEELAFKLNAFLKDMEISS